MSSAERHEEQPDSLLFRYLRTWQRWPLGVLAVVMLTFGGYAIMEGHDGLATSTYVVAGIVVGAVAVTGVVPRRITYKDATIDFIVQQRVQREVQTAVEEVADEVAEAEDWASLQQRFEELAADPWRVRTGWEVPVEVELQKPPPSVEVFSRRLSLVRGFEDRALAILQDYAAARQLEVRRGAGSGEIDCLLVDPSGDFSVPVIFKYRWTNDSVTRLMGALWPRVLFMCSELPTRRGLDGLRDERLGIQFAIVRTQTSMLDDAVAWLRTDVPQASIKSLAGGGWFLSLPRDVE